MSTDAILGQTMDAQVRPYLDLIDRIRGVGIERDFEIPQIAVMGDQSSGKSSVLESISGVPFPRGTGLVTKCATELRMKTASNGADWSATARISWDKSHPGPRTLRDAHELGTVIEEFTTIMLESRGDGATFEAEHSIVIELVSPDVPNLTLIDLPGIVRTNVSGQDKSVMASVNALLERYLKKERTIILAVIPCNVDIATVDILERAVAVDPKGVRTIGVLTKPDLIDKGGEQEVVSVLLGERKALNLGYYMVKNRSQKQLAAEMSLAEARGEELAYFSAHPDFGESTLQPRLGIQNLVTGLTHILVGHIQDSLPGMRKDLLAQLEKTRASLHELGEPLPHGHESQRIKLTECAQQVANVIGDATSGVYSNQLFTSAPELRMIANIRKLDGPHETFAAAIKASKPTTEWAVPTLREKIASMRGREVHGILNWATFDLMIRQTVEDWRQPMHELLDDIVQVVQTVCEGVISYMVPALKAVQAKITDVTLELINQRAQEVRAKVIPQLIESERSAFTKNPAFSEAYNRMRLEEFERAFDKHADGGNGRENFMSKDRMLEWYSKV